MKKQYELIKSYHTHKNKVGVYGVYHKNKCLYVGSSMNVGRRCFKDHFKPSQFLLQRILSEYYNTDNYGAYYHKSYKLRNKLEFRLLAAFGDEGLSRIEKHEMLETERKIINKLKPTYNINK